MENVLVTPRQYDIISILVQTQEKININDLAARLGSKPEDLMRDLAELEAKGLVIIEKAEYDKITLTSEGVKRLREGLPEELVYKGLSYCIDLNVDEFLKCISTRLNIDENDVKIGLQYLVKGKCLVIENGIVKYGSQDRCIEIIESAGFLRKYLSNIARGESVSREVVKLLRRRKMIDIERSSIMYVRATDKLIKLWNKGLITRASLATVVSPKLVETGEISRVIIKEFDLRIPPPRARLQRLNSYMEFLDLVREILVSMGFEEVKGPHVELEFWNFDALFQAQDHPAREIHDTFYLKTSFRGKVPEELLKRAKEVHEKGWGYRWSIDKALTPILRTQTTAVSARILYERGAGEYRCFSLDRVFRPETLDAKHAMEFYQLEGIIVGKNVTFKDLLAFFREFAAALGIKEIWFKPGYFPFTEPSVEGFIKHPKLGWVEVFPGGMFRPEVLEILGVKGVNVAAWGIGIDRLAMTILGIDDIRDLFSKDLDFIEKIKEPKIPYFTRKTSARDVKVVKFPYL